MIKLICFLLAGLFFVSCGNVKDLAYIKDIEDGIIEGAYPGHINTIKKGDILLISVSSSKPEMAIPYNLFTTKNQMTGGSSSLSSSVNRVTSNVTYEGYTVDTNGDIQFPIFGELHIEGLTRQELSEMLQEKLLPVLPDPIVTVTFLNFFVTVLGEVNRPGVYNLPGDKITLFEALGFAGDLTVHGQRSRIVVIREGKNGKEVETLDIKSKEIFKSPYFYLQQNDVIYVEPIAAKAKSVSSFNTYFPIITSLASLGTSIAMIIYYIAFTGGR